MNDKELLKKKFIVRQGNYYRIRWDMFVILLSVWNSFTAPIEYSFAKSKNMEFFKSDTLITINIVIDLIFILDVGIIFRTSYIHPQTGEEIFDPKAIAYNYIGGTFLIDFVSAIPFDLIDMLQ